MEGGENQKPPKQKKPKTVLQELKVSFNLSVTLWQMISGLPRETGYCATLLPQVFFKETLIEGSVFTFILNAFGG